ncbi:MAG TPA: CDP-alcohol phosphatidyltransferase family protein [Chitinophagaceae bacterium]|nr:CDP-alcohol phosphatidyltransferase family protein [Chitinophagaceae bacterium]
MKQIPNLFTLLNLIFGCIAIVYILEPGLILLPLNDDGNILIPPRQLEYTPEKTILASLFIGLAGVVDFFDGFAARLFKSASELGKQLDSLADTVSFCVAPSMIVYQFLRLSYAQHGDSFDTSFIWLVPAFIIAAAGAYRLGKFNLDSEQSYSFKGVPTPAIGLLIASFPLIYWYTDSKTVIEVFLNKWFWYGFIFLVSYLMVSKLPIMGLKFKDFTLRNNIPKIILIATSVLLILFLKWLAVPAIFILYIAVSLAFKNKSA